MMTRDADKKREQMMMFSMDDMVPKDHMLRKIDRAIDWNFIYDLVEDKYCADNGRPSMDPVMLIKIPFIQYLETFPVLLSAAVIYYQDLIFQFPEPVHQLFQTWLRVQSRYDHNKFHGQTLFLSFFLQII